MHHLYRCSFATQGVPYVDGSRAMCEAVCSYGSTVDPLDMGLLSRVTMCIFSLYPTQGMNTMTLITNVVARHVEAFNKTALRQKALKALMEKGNHFGVMSAYGPFSKSKNQERHGELMAELQKMGYKKIEPLKGSWDGVAEKSVLIPNIKPADLFKLSQKFDQVSAIYKSPDDVIGMYFNKDKTATVAMRPDKSMAADLSNNEDLYSKGRNFSFSFGFLWGEKMPWDGKSAVKKADVLDKIDINPKSDDSGSSGSEDSKPEENTKDAPANWDEFLKERYDGGKKKVPNPNSDTKSTHPQVAVSTALKNDGYRRRLQQEYKKWDSGKQDYARVASRYLANLAS